MQYKVARKFARHPNGNADEYSQQNEKKKQKSYEIVAANEINERIVTFVKL